MATNTWLGGVRADFALFFGSVFLLIFAGAMVYIFTQADFSQVVISGTISVETLMGTFIGIVIAVIGFLGITRNRAVTPGSQQNQN